LHFQVLVEGEFTLIPTLVEQQFCAVDEIWT